MAPSVPHRREPLVRLSYKRGPPQHKRARGLANISWTVAVWALNRDNVFLSLAAITACKGAPDI